MSLDRVPDSILIKRVLNNCVFQTSAIDIIDDVVGLELYCLALADFVPVLLLDGLFNVAAFSGVNVFLFYISLL